MQTQANHNLVSMLLVQKLITKCQTSWMEALEKIVSNSVNYLYTSKVKNFK